MEENEAKLKLYGILAETPDFDVRILVQRYGVTIHKLRRWARDYKAEIENSAVEKLVDMDTVVSNRIIEAVADHTAEDIVKTTPKLNLDEPKDENNNFVKELPKQDETEITELVIDEITNDIIPKTELDRRSKEREDEQMLSDTIANEYKLGLNGLKDLKEATYDTALNLVKVVNDRIRTIAVQGTVTANNVNVNGGLPTYTRDVVELSQAICNIQNAFFNKPVTNVTVGDGAKVGILADFRETLTN